MPSFNPFSCPLINPYDRRFNDDDDRLNDKERDGVMDEGKEARAQFYFHVST